MNSHRIYTLRYDARPHTINQERKLHWGARAQWTREWRDAFCLLAKAENIPPLTAICVVAIPHLRDQRTQDVAACLPSVKASIDGLVDAGVIPDDDHRYVHRLTFTRPVHDGRDCLALIVSEVA